MERCGSGKEEAGRRDHCGIGFAPVVVVVLDKGAIANSCTLRNKHVYQEGEAKPSWVS